MIYQNIIDLLDNKTNQPSKFRTEDLVKINDDLHGTYNIIIVKSNSKLDCYSHAYVILLMPWYLQKEPLKLLE